MKIGDEGLVGTFPQEYGICTYVMMSSLFRHGIKTRERTGGK